VGNKSKLLDNTVVTRANTELKKLGQYGMVSRKLLAIIAASKHSIAEVSKVYDISRGTLTQWIKHIKDSKLDKLKAPPERRKKTKLQASQVEEIEKWMEHDPNITINEVRLRIDSVYEIQLGKSTVHRIMTKLKFAYITPRPKHYKQDVNLIEDFKKKST
jgi:transposase